MNGIISRVTRAAVDHPGRFLLAALLVTAVSVKIASGLELRSSFAELLPEDVPSVHEIKEMGKRVGGDGTILVLIQSLKGPEGLKRIDEDTAIVVEDGAFGVHGRAGVYVVDGAGVTQSNIAEAKPDRALSIFDIRMHVLSAGDRFDLKTLTASEKR